MDKDCEKRLSQIVQGFSECKDAFTAIGDETRQLILMVLLESDLSGIRVGEIARKTHLTRPSVSHHLKILKEADIVAMRKEGTNLQDATVKDLCKCNLARKFKEKMIKVMEI